MSELIRLTNGPLQTERMPDGRRRLLRALGVDVAGKRFTVPRGAETDFSSIPWFGRFLVRWSKVDVAGVVHDWLYGTGGTTRAEADEIWRLIALAGEHHANAVQARVGWLGLRAFGWIVWDRYRKCGVADPPSV